MKTQKNIIIKITTWLNDSPEDKRIEILKMPMDLYGTEVYFDITHADEGVINGVMQSAFIFNPNSTFLENYTEGTDKKCQDAHYREFTKVTEFIKTEREETKHFCNGWESKVVQEEIREWVKIK